MDTVSFCHVRANTVSFEGSWTLGAVWPVVLHTTVILSGQALHSYYR